MAELKNEFSWSWSRHRAFEECRRRYWLNHYAFWGGWQSSSPAREIYIQKKLTSRPQWIGTTVHQAAEWVLREVRRGHYPTPDRVVERFMRQARRQIDESRREMYKLRPKRAPGFVDHYYAQGTSDEQWEADLSEIERQIRGLFDEPVFLRLTRVPEQIKEVEELEQVLVDDVPVWVSLDVLVSDGSGGLVVIDWKTGRQHDPDTVARQLGVYGVYVMQRYFHVPATSTERPGAERVKVMYVNLRTGHRETRTLDTDVLAGTVSTILESAAAMRTALRDPATNTGSEADFPMIEAGSPACERCVFRRTCGRE